MISETKHLKENLRLRFRMAAKVCNLKVAVVIFSLLIGAQLAWAEAEPPHQHEAMTITSNEENQPLDTENVLEANPENVPYKIKPLEINTDQEKANTTLIDKSLFLLKDVVNRAQNSLFGREEAEDPATLHLFTIRVLIFAAVGLVAYIIFSLLPGKLNPTKDRLAYLQFGEGTQGQKKLLSQSKRKDTNFLKERLRGIGQIIIPRSEEARSKMKMELFRAGIKHRDAVSLYSGIKVLFALFFMGGFILIGLAMKMKPGHIVVFSLATAGLGMYIPILWIRFKANKRKAIILSGFSDTLDLLAVCVDAGLGLNAAMSRVSDEMRLANKELSEELQLVNFEIRAGKPRSEALHNLGLRTDVEDIQSMVAMLIQAEKFGTSIARSLRLHSDSARTKRKLKAEEAAAKTTVKIVFPLLLFILPALFVIVMAPAVLQIIKNMG